MGLLPPLIVHLQADITNFQSRMGLVKSEMAGVEAFSGKAFLGMAATGKVSLMTIGALPVTGAPLRLTLGDDFASPE